MVFTTVRHAMESLIIIRHFLHMVFALQTVSAEVPSA